MALTPNTHLTPYETETDRGTLTEWIEINTYEELTLANLSICGNNANYDQSSIDLWVTEEDIRSIRDALNKVLGE